MSRAFVKEPDGDAIVDDAPEFPVSPHPNHVTARGLVALKNELDDLTQRRRLLLGSNDDMGAKLEIAAMERRQRYVIKRIDSAIEHDPGQIDSSLIGFGATVSVEDEGGTVQEFTIVGEDEADPTSFLISWTSPLARQLLGKEPGDEIRWIRPKGDVMLNVISIRYGVKSLKQ